MAGDWIPMRLDLAEDPAVIGIADRTGLAEDTVVGKLHRLWSWANKQLRDGNAESVTKSFVDRHVAHQGFAQAMVEVGWLVASDRGITFPKFETWNSGGSKNRLLSARRMAEMRLRKSNVRSVTKPQPEKRREEKSKEEPPLPPKGEGEELSRKTEKKPRPRNPVYDALAEVTGLDPKTAGARLGTASATIASAGYTADDVRQFGSQFWTHCPYAKRDNRTRPTPHEVSTNIGLIRAGPAIQSSGPTPPAVFEPARTGKMAAEAMNQPSVIRKDAP